MSYRPEQLSDTVNRPSRDVWVRPSSGRDLVDTIKAYIHDARIIKVPKGVYIPTETITEILNADEHPHIIGAGSYATRINSSLPKVFDFSQTPVAVSAAKFITIEGLQIMHNCQNATDLTMDLKNVQVNLKDILCYNTNGTRRGAAYDCGYSDDTGAPTGSPCTWENLCADYYADGFKLGLDHLTLLNPMAYGCSGKAFWIENAHNREVTPDEYYANWISLFHPQVAIGGAEATVYPFYFRHIGFDVKVYAPDIEGTSITTNELLFMEPTAALSYVVLVHGLSCAKEQTNICNDYKRIIIEAGYAWFQRLRRGVGRDTTPVHAAQVCIGLQGSAASPAASTDYVISQDCYLTCSDSGGANCGWLLKDFVGGNTILSLGHTVTGQFCKAGTAINAGAFTGAAPTMTAYFM